MPSFEVSEEEIETIKALRAGTARLTLVPLSQRSSVKSNNDIRRIAQHQLDLQRFAAGEMDDA